MEKKKKNIAAAQSSLDRKPKVKKKKKKSLYLDLAERKLVTQSNLDSVLYRLIKDGEILIRSAALHKVVAVPAHCRRRKPYDLSRGT
uniref:Uncharacterized protein n=1 Tax=Cannabis sativa TaxID=3483 RepID=A0A803QYJ9_CANSA